MSDVLHDLTLLYMKHSLNLSEMSKPEDYGRIYFESYLKIKDGYTSAKREYSASRPSIGPTFYGVSKNDNY
ncbi:hypothetical protein [Aneurinibacillus aneurinilyticus]|uniref:hypothetical protein n=1 Tax=Aneurinibacillus aneurinilyticus TaxID=1391 RepID=UPI0035256C99